MTLDHVTDQDALGLLSGELGKESRNRIVRHILRGCRSCQQRFMNLGVILPEDGIAEERLPSVKEELYEGILDRAISRIIEQVPLWEQEETQLAQLVTTVTAGSEVLSLLPQSGEDLNGELMVRALLKSSFEARFQNVETMRALAMSAASAAQNLKPGELRPELIADLQARAWGELGNAYRTADDFEKAEDAFVRAFEVWEQGSGDLMLLARLLDLEASLRTAQRRLTEALENLEEAQQIYLQFGERHLAGGVLIKKGNNHSYDGRQEEASQCYQEGLSLLDPKRDSQLAAITRYDLIYSLLDCGRFQEAGRILLQSNLRQAFSSQPLNLLRLRWLEAKISLEVGRLPRAENILREVQEEFLERGQEYDAALVGLDLAEVLLRRGRSAEVRPLARKLLETFENLGVQPEALRAMQYLRA